MSSTVTTCPRDSWRSFTGIPKPADIVRKFAVMQGCKGPPATNAATTRDLKCYESGLLVWAVRASHSHWHCSTELPLGGPAVGPCGSGCGWTVVLASSSGCINWLLSPASDSPFTFQVFPHFFNRTTHDTLQFKSGSWQVLILLVWRAVR